MAKDDEKSEKKREAPKPIDLKYDIIGSNGKYEIYFQVVFSDGIGHPSSLRFIDGSVAKGPLPTDNNGYLGNFKPDEFDEKEKRLKVCIVGTGIEYSIKLKGPKQKGIILPSAGSGGTKGFCPRCQDDRWDGKRCPVCNYPKDKKPII